MVSTSGGGERTLHLHIQCTHIIGTAHAQPDPQRIIAVHVQRIYRCTLWSLCAYTTRALRVCTGATRDGPRNAPDDTDGHDLSPRTVGSRKLYCGFSLNSEPLHALTPYMSTYMCYVSYDTQSPLISRGVARRASRRPAADILYSSV